MRRSRLADPRRHAGVVIAAGVLALATACSYTIDLAPIPPASESSTIVASDGTVLATLDAGEHRIPVSFDEMSPALRDAVVAVEDHRFWEHSGIDLRSVGRALARDAAAGEITQGGSTITQQYVRAVMLGREQTVSRKLKEAALALEFERRFDKKEILERYLNIVYFGNGAYGAQAAAQTYFGVDAADLDVGQGALLAGLIQAPERYDPVTRPDAALDRRNLVLDRMAEYGLADAETVAQARSEPLGLHLDPARDRYPAGHFVERVKELLLDQPALGETRDERRRLLFQGGLQIETTLDMRLQLLAEDAVAKVIVDPDNDPAAALVALDPTTGAVVAYVGGRDFFGSGPSAKFDLASQGRRPAGSSFKPFVLAAALDAGIPLDSTYDAPASIDIDVRGEAPWKVRNYDGKGAGRVDLVDATVFSLNTVYAQLIMDVGPARVVDLAARMGIESPLAPIPSAALGTNEVSVLDMASAYSTFAADGVHAPPSFVTRVTGPDGEVLWESTPRSERVLPESTARRVTGVLTQVVSRGTGVNARIGRPVAGKTGTGEEWRDAWFVGYTPQLVAAVWVGFPDAARSMVPPTARAQVTGGLWPAQIWGLFAGAALADTPTEPFPPPDAGADAPPSAPLPDVVGMPVDRASELLVDAGYTVTTVDEPSRDYPPGTVLRQEPFAHAPVTPGTLVTLTAAGGAPDRTVVPDVLGLLADEAGAAAAFSGLTLDLVIEAEPPPGSPARVARVWKQVPPSGTEVDAGTTLRAWVNP